MQILSSCFYLGGVSFISRFANDIASIILSLIGNIRDSAYTIISQTMEVLLKVAPSEGAILLEEVLARLVKLLLTPDEGARVPAGTNTIIFSAVIAVFSRVAIWRAAFIPEALTKAAAAGFFESADGELTAKTSSLLPCSSTKRI